VALRIETWPSGHPKLAQVHARCAGHVTVTFKSSPEIDVVAFEPRYSGSPAAGSPMASKQCLARESTVATAPVFATSRQRRVLKFVADGVPHAVERQPHAAGQFCGLHRPEPGSIHLNGFGHRAVDEQNEENTGNGCLQFNVFADRSPSCVKHPRSLRVRLSADEPQIGQ
jgi:hypothetical protein